jgi:uncharacterized protein
MRRCIAALALLLALCGEARPAEVANLYEAKVLVTGQGDANRRYAFVRTLAMVLVKVSGDPQVSAGRRISGREAGRFVLDYSYRDTLADLPIHDEQGTRDRPYEVTVRFAPEKIDALLRRAGRKPWGASRPRVAVLLRVENGPTRFHLSRDGESGRDQREALAAAADRFGLPVVLPDAAMLEGDPSRLDAQALGSDVVLRGELVWSDRALGWTAAWTLDAQGKTHRFGIRGVNFDTAFRNAMSRTLGILRSP